MIQQHNWNYLHEVNYLANRLDDESLDLFDNIDQETKRSYEDTKQEIIDHYDSTGCCLPRWSRLITRKQQLPESITRDDDVSINLATNLHIADRQFFWSNKCIKGLISTIVDKQGKQK